MAIERSGVARRFITARQEETREREIRRQQEKASETAEKQRLIKDLERKRELARARFRKAGFEEKQGRFFRLKGTKRFREQFEDFRTTREQERAERTYTQAGAALQQLKAGVSPQSESFRRTKLLADQPEIAEGGRRSELQIETALARTPEERRLAELRFRQKEKAREALEERAEVRRAQKAELGIPQREAKEKRVTQEKLTTAEKVRLKNTFLDVQRYNKAAADENTSDVFLEMQKSSLLDKLRSSPGVRQKDEKTYVAQELTKPIQIKPASGQVITILPESVKERQKRELLMQAESRAVEAGVLVEKPTIGLAPTKTGIELAALGAPGKVTSTPERVAAQQVLGKGLEFAETKTPVERERLAGAEFEALTTGARTIERKPSPGIAGKVGLKEDILVSPLKYTREFKLKEGDTITTTTVTGSERASLIRQSEVDTRQIASKAATLGIVGVEEKRASKPAFIAGEAVGSVGALLGAGLVGKPVGAVAGKLATRVVNKAAAGKGARALRFATSETGAEVGRVAGVTAGAGLGVQAIKETGKSVEERGLTGFVGKGIQFAGFAGALGVGSKAAGAGFSRTFKPDKPLFIGRSAGLREGEVTQVFGRRAEFTEKAQLVTEKGTGAFRPDKGSPEFLKSKSKALTFGKEERGVTTIIAGKPTREGFTDVVKKTGLFSRRAGEKKTTVDVFVSRKEGTFKELPASREFTKASTFKRFTLEEAKPVTTPTLRTDVSRRFISGKLEQLTPKPKAFGKVQTTELEKLGVEAPGLRVTTGIKKTGIDKPSLKLKTRLRSPEQKKFYGFKIVEKISKPKRPIGKTQKVKTITKPVSKIRGREELLTRFATPKTRFKLKTGVITGFKPASTQRLRSLTTTSTKQRQEPVSKLSFDTEKQTTKTRAILGEPAQEFTPRKGLISTFTTTSITGGGAGFTSTKELTTPKVPELVVPGFGFFSSDDSRRFRRGKRRKSRIRKNPVRDIVKRFL